MSPYSPQGINLKHLALAVMFKPDSPWPASVLVFLCYQGVLLVVVYASHFTGDLTELTDMGDADSDD